MLHAVSAASLPGSVGVPEEAHSLAAQEALHQQVMGFGLDLERVTSAYDSLLVDAERDSVSAAIHAR